MPVIFKFQPQGGRKTGAENSLRLSEPSLWLKRSAGEIDVSRRGDGENASRESVCFLALRSHDSVAQENETTQDVEGRVSDTIEMKYRYYNGHVQCRRWNATQGYWVDPYWRNVT